MNTQHNSWDLGSLPEHGQRHVNAEQEARSIPQPIAQTSDFAAAQWTSHGPGIFQPSGRSFAALPTGFYRGETTMDNVVAVKANVITDKLAALPGGCNETVIANIRKFWQSKEMYRRYGLAYKRGVLFYGPPGSGKTSTIALLCLELMAKHEGLVFICQNPGLLVKLLSALRKIEPDRPVIVIMEDLDEIISCHGEHNILALLDGEMQIDNAVFLASTNYPERLGARIVNRPARFDERILVDMPAPITRRAYLEMVTNEEPLSDAQLVKWTRDTQGMSISHIRELVVAVRCLGQDYKDVLEKLRSMQNRPRAEEGLGNKMGLLQAAGA